MAPWGGGLGRDWRDLGWGGERRRGPPGPGLRRWFSKSDAPGGEVECRWWLDAARRRRDGVRSLLVAFDLEQVILVTEPRINVCSPSSLALPCLDDRTHPRP